MMQTVHYAPLAVKCLMHRAMRYVYGMETPNQRLRWLREQKGLATVEEGAKFVGANVNTYRQHENDTRNLGGIPRRAAEQYAAKYRVSLDWLMRGKGDEPETEPTEDDLAEMVRVVIEDVVTVQTKIADLPRIVAPGLREQLERYRADRARPAKKGASTAPGKGAPPPSPTR